MNCQRREKKKEREQEGKRRLKLPAPKLILSISPWIYEKKFPTFLLMVDFVLRKVYRGNLNEAIPLVETEVTWILKLQALRPSFRFPWKIFLNKKLTFTLPKPVLINTRWAKFNLRSTFLRNNCRNLIECFKLLKAIISSEIYVKPWCRNSLRFIVTTPTKIQEGER